MLLKHEYSNVASLIEYGAEYNRMRPSTHSNKHMLWLPCCGIHSWTRIANTNQRNMYKYTCCIV